MKSLLSLLRRPLLHVGALSLFINLLLLIPSIFMLQVFDRVLVSASHETLWLLLAGAAIGLGWMFLLEQVRGRLQGVAGNLVAEVLSPAITRLAVAQGARRSGRASGEGLRDIASVRALFTAQGLLAAADAPWMLVYITLIWAAHTWLGVTALLSAALMLGLAVVNDRLTRRDIEAVQKSAAGAQRYLETSLANAEVAHGLGMTDALIARWRQKNQETLSLQGPLARHSVALSALTRTLRQAVQIAMLAVGAWLVISGQASPGVTIACTILLGRALAPVEMIVGSWKLLAEGRAAFLRLAHLLDTAAAEPARMPLPPPRGQLDAQQLVLRAPQGDRLLVGGVSLHLEPGQALAVIGPSGAGKSTLLRLLAGIWPATAGTVRLDGSDLGLWPREALGPWIGFVPQDVELFPGTVAENIARLGEMDAAQVVEAAQRARVHEMIQALPEGYDTVIDPHSAVVSPGQRQRIALARALYGQPRLLLLDEPNANLDGAGEQALADTLRTLRGEVTVVVVTHRTALLQQVDQLLVMEAGRAVQYGPVAEVLKAMQSQAQAAAAGGRVVTMPRAASASAPAPMEART